MKRIDTNPLQWRHLDPARRVPLAVAVTRVQRQLWENRQHFPPSVELASTLELMGDVVERFSVDLDWLDALADPSMWNLDVLGRTPAGGPARRPRVELRAGPNLVGNLVVDLLPYGAGSASTCEFARNAFVGLHATRGSAGPDEIVHVFGAGSLFHEGFGRDSALGHLRSDVMALTVVAFEELAARIGRTFEVVRDQDLRPVLDGSAADGRVLELDVGGGTDVRTTRRDASGSRDARTPAAGKWETRIPSAASPGPDYSERRAARLAAAGVSGASGVAGKTASPHRRPRRPRVGKGRTDVREGA